jgi:very-short-patch-repair endonuclease
VIDGFIADFYCHRAGLVIEVDGDLHDPDYDRERDLVFGQRGLRVLRFRNREVFHELERVLEMIREALTSPPSPLS